jgi:hypothetical protein
MNDDMAAGLHLAIVCAIAWAVVCRARLMDGDTDPMIRWQHGLLNAGALGSLGVPEHWRVIVLAAGVAAFLALSAPRWRHAAPVDTRPADLDEMPRGAERAAP